MTPVEFRLSGDLPGIATALRVLRDAAEIEGFEIGEPSRPYPNRREPGYRVYLALRLPADGDTTEQRGAAHRRQAIRRPAAPLPAKETRGKRHLP